MNKYLVVYSSRTGNTKKIAETARVVLGDTVDIVPIEEEPSPNGYNWTAIGFWVDKENVDSLTQAYLKKITKQQVALFCTLGTPPEMLHAQKCMEKAISYLGIDCKLLGTFMCQGKVAGSAAIQVEKMAKEKGDKKMLQLFRDIIKSAETHPDDEDIKRAQDFFNNLVSV